MIEQFHLSERHACEHVGLSRDSYRHRPKPDAMTVALKIAMVDIAHQRRRFGYRRIHDLLRPSFANVNYKRSYRLYSEAGPTMRRRKKAKRPDHEHVPLQIAYRISEVWSMDFASDKPGQRSARVTRGSCARIMDRGSPAARSSAGHKNITVATF